MIIESCQCVEWVHCDSKKIDHGLIVPKIPKSYPVSNVTLKARLIENNYEFEFDFRN